MRVIDKEQFLQDYQTYFGENLSDILSASPQYEKNDTMFINMIVDKVESLIKNHYADFDYNADTTDGQKDAIHKAELYQAFYEAHSVDFDNLAGYDGATLIKKADINEHRYSERTIEILRNNYLLNKPIRGVQVW